MKKITEIYDIDLYDKNKESNEIILEVFCTDKCNYNCYYCINLKNLYVRKNKQLDLNILYDFIVWLNKKTQKSIRVILIGGEPTLHTDFLNFAKKCTLQNFKITLESFTNLSQDENFYIQSFKYNMQYKVSFHYLNDVRMDNFRKKIISLNNYDNIQQIFVMCEQNYFNKCIQMFDYLYEIFKEKVICCLLDDSNKDNLIYNRKMRYSDLQILEYEKRCNTKTIDEFYIQYADNTYEHKPLYYIKNNPFINFKHWLCNAGKDFFSIDFDGNIYPCGQMHNRKLAHLSNFKTIKFNKYFCSSSICCNYELLKKRIF